MINFSVKDRLDALIGRI